jgi:hypothetical protein
MKLSSNYVPIPATAFLELPLKKDQVFHPYRIKEPTSLDSLFFWLVQVISPLVVPLLSSLPPAPERFFLFPTHSVNRKIFLQHEKSHFFPLNLSTVFLKDFQWNLRRKDKLITMHPKEQTLNPKRRTKEEKISGKPASKYIPVLTGTVYNYQK